jgi:hypothetical protein
MDERMDQKHVSIGKSEDLDKEDKNYWSGVDVVEKLRTITYLRECFYGQEATYGRLQRVCTVFKQTEE